MAGYTSGRSGGWKSSPGIRPERRQGLTKAFVLVDGGDGYLAAQEVRSLRRQWQQALPEAETIDLDAGESGTSDFDEAVSPSLLSPSSIVVVEHLEDADPKLVEAMTRFVERAAKAEKEGREPDNVVIARRSAGQKGLGAARAVKKAGASSSTVPVLQREDARRAFARSEFARREKEIEPRGLDILVSVLGSRTAELAAMCGQLCDDAQGGTITAQEVESEMSGLPEVSSFAISDEAFSGNLAGAVERTRQTLSSGVEPIAIIAALASGLRQLALVAAINAGTVSQEEAGIRSWWILRTRKSQLRGWTSAGMARCFEALAHADEEAKTNDGDPVYALEKAVELIARKGSVPAV